MQALEGDALASDADGDEDNADDDGSAKARRPAKVYDHEQEELRKAFFQAAQVSGLSATGCDWQMAQTSHTLDKPSPLLSSSNAKGEGHEATSAVKQPGSTVDADPYH